MLNLYRALLALALCLCALAPVRASTPPDSLRTALDHVFAPLDLGQVPTP